MTENADRKCRKVVREAKSFNPDSFIALIGCYAQLKPGEIAEIPGVDAVLGANEKFRLLELLGDFEHKTKPQVYAGDIREVESYHTSYSINDRTRTFLKVQDGCNFGCAFCTIPLARGKSRSDSVGHVADLVREIRVREIREIVLTGVNTGDFGVINGRRRERFIVLIRELDEVEGIERFRIS